MEEVIDVYDADRNKTGRTAIRGKPRKEGDYYLVIHVCLINKDNKMLIQKRTNNKKKFAGLWDISVGGYASKGESSREAAERETFEELGIKIDLKNIRPNMTVNFLMGFDDYFIIPWDGDLNNLTLQESEVSEVKWATKEEIFSMIEKGEFISYLSSLISFIFDTKGNYGCHVKT